MKTLGVSLDLNMGGKFLRPECANTVRARAGQGQWGGGIAVPIEFKYQFGNSRCPWNKDGTAQAIVAGVHDASVVILRY